MPIEFQTRSRVYRVVASLLDRRLRLSIPQAIALAATASGPLGTLREEDAEILMSWARNMAEGRSLHDALKPDVTPLEFEVLKRYGLETREALDFLALQMERLSGADPGSDASPLPERPGGGCQVSPSEQVIAKAS